MNELTTDVKTHVVITFSKVHHFITQPQYETLLHLSTSGQKVDGVDIDGNFVKFNNIADILTMEKYRESFPEKLTDTHQPYSEQKYDTSKLFQGDYMGRLLVALEKDYEKNPTEGRRRQLVSLRETKRRRDERLDKGKPKE